MAAADIDAFQEFLRDELHSQLAQQTEILMSHLQRSPKFSLGDNFARPFRSSRSGRDSSHEVEASTAAAPSRTSGFAFEPPPEMPAPPQSRRSFRPLRRSSTLGSTAESVMDLLEREDQKRHAEAMATSVDENGRAVKSTYGSLDKSERKEQQLKMSNTLSMGPTPSSKSVIWPRQEKTLLQEFVYSFRFEMFFAFVIVTNSILIGVMVQWQAAYPSSPLPLAFYILQQIYALTFLTELLLRVAADGIRIFCSEQWIWNGFDVLIVAFSMLETVVDMIYLLSRNSNAEEERQHMSNIRIVRIIRITRLIRIFRITRIMRFVRALRTLVWSIIYTLKSLIWAMLLLMIIMYVFGILFTQAASDFLVSKGVFMDGPTNAASEALDSVIAIRMFWSSLPVSMFTLFKAIAGGLSWHDAVQAFDGIGVHLSLLFIFFVAFAYFAVLNVVTAVFCQSAMESATNDREMVVHAVLSNKQAYIDKITILFKGMDHDNDGLITLQEFKEHLTDPEVKAYFDILELETQDAWTLFKLLDQDKQGVIDSEEFVMGCVRLKGGAKGIDIAKLMYENKLLIKRLTSFMKSSEHQFDRLAAEVATANLQAAAALAALRLNPRRTGPATRPADAVVEALCETSGEMM